MDANFGVGSDKDLVVRSDKRAEFLQPRTIYLFERLGRESTLPVKFFEHVTRNPRVVVAFVLQGKSQSEHARSFFALSSQLRHRVEKSMAFEPGPDC